MRTCVLLGIKSMIYQQCFWKRRGLISFHPLGIYIVNWCASNRGGGILRLIRSDNASMDGDIDNLLILIIVIEPYGNTTCWSSKHVYTHVLSRYSLNMIFEIPVIKDHCLWIYTTKKINIAFSPIEIMNINNSLVITDMLRIDKSPETILFVLHRERTLWRRALYCKVWIYRRTFNTMSTITVCNIVKRVFIATR